MLIISLYTLVKWAPGVSAVGMLVQYRINVFDINGKKHNISTLSASLLRKNFVHKRTANNQN